MKDKFFIDTNILVYANDRSEKEKQDRAKQILFDGIAHGNIAISSQVLGEFYVTVTRKIVKTLASKIAQKQIGLFKSIEIVDINFYLVMQAIRISRMHSLSYWDALIIAAAEKSKCSIIYSEDLNPGQVIDGVTVENPFI